jgi:GntR family transcriptional regulator of arabinose operon
MPVAELPKYEQVKKTLISDIEAGRWSPGGAIPSEAQLLKRFKVSRPTLVRSLQDLVREGYLYRQQGRGTFVAERHGRGNGGGNGNGHPQRSITVFTARTVAAGSEVLLRILRGMQDVLGPAQLDLAIRYAAVGDLDEETMVYLDKTEPGVTVVVEPSFSTPLRDELLRRGWTVWAANEPWPDGNSVYIDQERSGYLATKYLIQRKHCRRIAMLNGPPEIYWGFGAKLRGYRAALTEAGIEPDAQLIREASHVTDTEAGRAMMRALLQEGVPVDGVVGASDSKVMGAMSAAQDAGRRVPQQLSMIGIDDIFASHATPPLPSVALPFEAVGRRVAQESLRLGTTSGHVASCVEIQLKPTLVER